MSCLIQEPRLSEADLVGISDIIDLGLGTSTAIGLAWIGLIALGTVAGPATVFGSKLSWPPKALHMLLILGVAGLAFSSWRDGLPPAVPADLSNAEPRDYAEGLQRGMVVLSQWVFLVSASAFALAFRAVRLREWWRLAGYLLMLSPQLVFALYSGGQLEDGWQAGQVEEVGAFLHLFFHNQYLYTSLTLAASFLLFLVLDQVQRRQRSSNEPDTD